MTTERSGMSLEQVRDEMRRAHTGPYTQGFHRWADAIDAHLSRNAVVSDEDVAAACKVYNETFNKLDAMRAALSSFAARHAAVPDGYVLAPVDPTVEMINAGLCGCMDNDVTVSVYKAMLAQRDGG